MSNSGFEFTGIFQSNALERFSFYQHFYPKRDFQKNGLSPLFSYLIILFLNVQIVMEIPVMNVHLVPTTVMLMVQIMIVMVFQTISILMMIMMEYLIT